MAEQEEPVRRRVALKVIKLGMDTKSVIARFEAERQALALMDHPNIAKVFDAGTTGAAIARIGETGERGNGDAPSRPLADSPSQNATIGWPTLGPPPSHSGASWIVDAPFVAAIDFQE